MLSKTAFSSPNQNRARFPTRGTFGPPNVSFNINFVASVFAWLLGKYLVCQLNLKPVYFRLNYNYTVLFYVRLEK
jgi:hypothetical protein